jgi:Mu-like prophage I protein
MNTAPAQPLPVLARAAASALPAAALPDRIMVMPAGVHAITASQAGRPVSLSVRVDRAAALALETARAAHARRPQRPFFDFSHEGKAASAWPTRFSWDPAGVFADVEWSEAGRDAVQGRSYRAFSPSFFVDEPASGGPAVVTGAPLCMGSLVNDPAFEEIQPIWAAHAAPFPHMTMNTTGEAAAGSPAPADAQSTTTAAAVSPAAPDDTRPPAGAPAAANAPDPAAELARLREENAALQAARTRDLDARAEAALDAAAARGAFPPRDADARRRWKGVLLAAGPDAFAALAAVASSPALNAARVAAPGSPAVIEAGADLRRAVLAYAQERDPMARGLLYRGGIAAAFRTEDGFGAVIQAARRVRGDLPVEAGNTLGTVAGALVTQRSLELLKVTFPVLHRITTDFSAENAMYGQTLSTRTRAVPAVTDYDPAQGYVNSAAQTTDVNVIINAHKAVQVTFNANELASTRRLLFGEQEEGIHYALGKNLVEAVYNLINGGTFANVTTQQLAGFNRTSLIAVARELTKRGVPTMNRTALLSSDYFAQLAADPALVTLAAFREPTIIEGYALPDVAGFRVIDAPNLPADNNLGGVGFTPGAFVLATRVPNNYADAFPGATGGGVTSVVTNPDSGLSVMLVEFVNHSLGQSAMRVALMYGVSAGQAAELQRIVSA